MFTFLQIIGLVSFCLLGFVCIASNALVCHVIRVRKTTGGALKYYVFSLAITDILVGVISIPLYILFLLKKVPSDVHKTLLIVYTSLDVFSGACSVLHLCIMAADRLVAVTRPFLRHRIVQQQQTFALKLLLFPWISSVVLASFTFKRAYIPHFSVIIGIIIFIIPAMILIVCYAVIFINVRLRNNRTRGRRISERRLVKAVFCVIVVFLVCWTPLHVINFSLGLGNVPWSNSTLEWLVGIAKWMQYLNSACNPFIYAIFHPTFRSAVIDVLRECSRRTSNDVPAISDHSSSNQHSGQHRSTRL